MPWRMLYVEHRRARVTSKVTPHFTSLARGIIWPWQFCYWIEAQMCMPDQTVVAWPFILLQDSPRLIWSRCCSSGPKLILMQEPRKAAPRFTMQRVPPGTVMRSDGK